MHRPTVTPLRFVSPGNRLASFVPCHSSALFATVFGAILTAFLDVPAAHAQAKQAKPSETAADDKTQDSPPASEGDKKPLTTDTDWKKWSHGKDHQDFDARVQAGDSDPETRRVIAAGVRQQIYAMSLPAQRDEVSTIVGHLLRSVRTAAAGKPAGEQRSFREAMMREIVDRCRELGDHQRYVRLNAAIILGNLFVVDGGLDYRPPPEFYSPAFDALLEILNKPGQAEEVKIRAVRGLENAAMFGNPSLTPSKNIQLGDALIRELENYKTTDWYQEVLCETLGSIDQVNNLDSQPFIVQALGRVLVDRKRTLCVRAAAAKAIGRAQLSPAVDLNPLVYGIADLSREIIEARNSKKVHVRRWCVVNVLLAFQPKNSYEKARHAGLLERVADPSYAKYRNAVNEVYKAVRPMIAQEFIKPDAPFPAAVLARINEWLKGNSSQVTKSETKQ